MAYPTYKTSATGHKRPNKHKHNCSEDLSTLLPQIGRSTRQKNQQRNIRVELNL